MPNIFDDLIPTSAASNIFDDIIPPKPKMETLKPTGGYDKFVADSLRNEILKNKAEGKTFDNTVSQPVERPVLDRLLAFTKAGTNATIPGMVAKAIGKPMLSGPDVEAAVSKYPGAGLAGSIAGGAPTYAGASLLGIPAPVSFGALGVGQEALAQKERETKRSLMLDKELTKGQKVGRLATSGVLNAATGAVFHEADLAKNILSGMAKAGFGAGANSLTESIVKRFISGEPQNVPEDLKNAGINALVIATAQGITRLPALRKEVWKAAEQVAKSKIGEKPVIKTYNDALLLLRKEGIEPEQLSVAWQQAKGIQSQADRIKLAEKHITEIASENGWSEKIVRQVMADRSKRQLLEGYYNWLYMKGKAAGIYEQAKVSYGEKLAKDAIAEMKAKEVTPSAPKEPIPGETAKVEAPIIPKTTIIPGEVAPSVVGPTLAQIRAEKGYVGDEQYKANLETNLKQYETKTTKTPEDLKYIEETKQKLQELSQPTGEGKVKNEFKVGDILDPQGNTNMVGKIKISGIVGNTLKFVDSEGTEFSGMQRSLVRDLVKGGSWKKVTTTEPLPTDKLAEFSGKELTPITSFEDPTDTQLEKIHKGKLLYSKKAGLINSAESELPARVIEDSNAQNLPQQDVRLGGTPKPNQNIPQEEKIVKGKKSIEYVEIKLSDEDKAIFTKIKEEVSKAQAGRKYVTRDEEGNVVHAGYEPGDFEFIPYWVKGWSKDNVIKIIDNAVNKGKLTIKQNEDLQLLLANYKEIANEEAKLKGEGVEQSEITEIERTLQEEVGDSQEVSDESGRVEEQAEVFPETKLDTTALYEQYYQDFISKKYSIPEAKRRAKAKLAETLKDETAPIPKSEEEQIAIQGGAAGFGTQEKGQKELFNKEAILDEYRKKTLPEYNTNKIIVSLDAFVDKIRELDPKKDDVDYKHGFRYEAKVSYPNSLGENGNYTTFIYKTKPTIAELQADILQEYRDFKKEINKEVAMGIAAKSGRDENIEAKIDEVLKDYGVEEKKPRSPGAGAQASYYGTNIDDFESVGAEGSKEEFKLFEKVKALAKKYAERVGEKYTGRRAVGLFFPHTKNIFLRALNNMSVAIHEVTHYLDDKFKIVKPLMEVVGETVSGNPKYAKESLPMRKALTDVYEKYYPGGRRTHKLEKRLTEGIATFIQKYVEMPTRMTLDYPLLVKEFLSESGKYHDPILNDFIRDAREIIREYQQLDALSKVKSRVVNASQISDVKSFLNLKEKIYTEIADNIFPIEKLGGDIHLWVRFFRTISGLISRNIVGNSGYYTIRNGKIIKLYDFSWNTIIKSLHDSGETEDFGAWLFARDTYFNYVELDKMKQNIANSLRAAAVVKGEAITEEEALRKAENMPEVREEALKLDKNGITKEVADKAYLDHKERFVEEAKMFDALTRADLDLLHDPQVGLVNYEKYAELTSKEGYASLKRDVYNEILGEPTEDIPVAKPRVGKNKISSMQSRHGSGLSVINPLFNGVHNHNEIIRKAIKQMIYNKVYKLRENFPGLFQQLPVETSTDKFGRIIFTQEKDPNIIMARENYKRKPLLVSKEIRQVLDEVLIHQKMHLIEEILVRMSRLFTKGTTGLYPQFAVSNFVVDQFTSVAQTKNNVMPVYTPLVELFKELLDKDSPDAEYFKEYLMLGGDRQTLVGWLDMTPNEFFRTISQEKKGIVDVLDKLESGAENILGAASKWSEIITRASEYIKARKAGKLQLEALEEAGQVTAPFHHIGRLGGGTIGKTTIKMIPFFSPAIQVLAQYGRTLHNPKSRKRALFVMGILTAVMIGSMYWLRKKGTKKQKEAIKGIQPNEMANYIWFPHPNGEDLIRLRIPEQMGIFGTMTNMLILDQMENAHYGADEYLDAATAWVPDQLNVTDPERLLVSWIPQLVRPALEVDINQRIYPKVTPLESSLMRELPPAERYTEKTSRLGRALGGKLGLSPIQWDHLIEGYFGRATRFAIGKEVGNPVVREIYTLSMRQVENYYEIKTKTEQQVNLMKKNPNRFTPEKRNKVRSDYQKSQRIANDIRIYRDMSKKNNKDPRLDTYRTKILDGIDSL